MAEYKNEELGVRFTMPDKPTVRQMLRYRSVLPAREGRATLYEDLWYAIGEMAGGWECEVVKPGDDLDKIDDARAADVIAWVIATGANHMNRVGTVPKN